MPEISPYTETNEMGLPLPPEPWQPLAWTDYWDLVEHRGFGREADVLRSRIFEYLRERERRYLMPAHVGTTVLNAFNQSPLSEVILTASPEHEDKYDEMMRRFEAEHLNLSPCEESNELRWWRGRSGEQPYYPAKTLARLLDIRPRQFLKMLIESSTGGLCPVIKSDNFIIAVQEADSWTSEEGHIIVPPNSVELGLVYELTELGHTYLGDLLLAYEEGMKSAQVTDF